MTLEIDILFVHTKKIRLLHFVPKTIQKIYLFSNIGASVQNFFLFTIYMAQWVGPKGSKGTGRSFEPQLRHTFRKFYPGNYRKTYLFCKKILGLSVQNFFRW